MNSEPKEPIHVAQPAGSLGWLAVIENATLHDKLLPLGALELAHGAQKSLGWVPQSISYPFQGPTGWEVRILEQYYSCSPSPILMPYAAAMACVAMQQERKDA